MKVPRALHAAAALAFLSCLVVVSPARAVTIAGVDVPEKAEVADQALVLNGAGLRQRFVFDVYVAALYVPAPSHNANDIIRGTGPRRIALTLLRDIDGSTLLDALNEGLGENCTLEELNALQPALARFSAIMDKAGDGTEGDTVMLDIMPGGVAVWARGQPLGTVQDPALGPALLRVWLGKKPAQADLKDALLGKLQPN